jgi:hypothetical protein
MKPSQIASLGELAMDCPNVKFPRDADGKVDLKNGRYLEAEKVKLKVKYEKEIQLCLGRAVIRNEDGSKVGKRANPFCYSGRIIITLKDHALKRKQETSRAKAFTSVGPGLWVSNQRQNGYFNHDNEPQLHLKGCAEATMGKLGKHAITTIGHIRDMTDESIQNIVAAESHLPRARLIHLHEQASKCHTGNKLSQGSKIIERKPIRMNQILVRIGNNTLTSL